MRNSFFLWGEAQLEDYFKTQNFFLRAQKDRILYVLTLLLHEEINSLLYVEQHSLFLDKNL